LLFGGVKKTLLKGDTVFAEEQLGGALVFINAALESSRYRTSASAVAAAWSSPTAAQLGSTSILFFTQSGINRSN
jgi:hypothetical protein